MRNTPTKAREAKKEKAVERNKQQVLRRIRQKMAVSQIQNKASQKKIRKQEALLGGIYTILS